MLYLGIDLGTTYSLVAGVNAQGVPMLYPDFHDANEFRTPSVVHIGDKQALVGSAVESRLENDPALPHARFFKLAMGQTGALFTDQQQRPWRPEALSALVLRKLMKDVAAFTSEPVDGVVITVPANFSDSQRHATQQAALMAGLPRPVLIEEPVAAATYYGHSRPQGEQTLLVYDLGGGTFDATLLQSAEAGLYALATEGCNTLGGKNIDEALMAWAAEEYQQVHGIMVPADAVSQAQLRRFATAAKLALSKPGATQIRRTLLIGRNTLDCQITRPQFETLTEHLIDETLVVCEHCLHRAGLDWSMVDALMLTGGSSLLPQVKERIATASGIPPDAMITRQPHQAVAFGAALIAQQIFAPSTGMRTLQRISSWALGIRVLNPETHQPQVQVLIPRDTVLPAEKTLRFYTHRADQTRLIIEAVQQKSSGEDISLGHFAFGPLAEPRLKYPVDIRLAYDEQGRVHITAKDGDTGQSMERILDDEGRSLAEGLLSQRTALHLLKINE